MRKFRSFLVIPLLIICLLLPGCSKYSSHFMATAMVHTGFSDSGSLSFYKFKGTYVLNLKGDDGEQILPVIYSDKGELEDGSVKVYYDNDGTKTELFSIESGDKVDDKSEPLKKGKTYIIIESDGEVSNGKFEFEIK